MDSTPRPDNHRQLPRKTINRARFLLLALVAPDMLLLDFEMAEPVELLFRAGQFVTLLFGDGATRKRAYSIASSPARKDGFQLLVKLVHDGLASAHFCRLEPGDEIAFVGPSGSFVADAAHAGDAVFAATGSGIAPIIPLCDEVLRRNGEAGRVRLYWGLRNAGDVFWLDRLESLRLLSSRFDFRICVSRPGMGWTGAEGRINQHVLGELPSLDRPVFYLVGNGEMIRELRQALVARGVDRGQQIRVEVFFPEVEP